MCKYDVMMTLSLGGNYINCYLFGGNLITLSWSGVLIFQMAHLSMEVLLF